MSDRLRARLAVAALNLAQRLLRYEAAEGDWDTCVHCGAGGCSNGTAVHDPDCEMETGLHIVTLRDLYPFGPSICDNCGTTLWPGDTEASIPRGDVEGIPVFETACVGCAAHASLSGNHP